MRILFIAILFLALAWNVMAEDKIFLYRDYYAGMSSEEFLKTGPAQCDKYPDGKMVCNHQKVVFAALEWTQFFEFKNNALTCVAFGHPLSMTAISAAMAWLQDENYAPITAETGRESLSFFPLYDENRKGEFKKESEKFNQNLTSADDFRSYLVKNSLLKEYKTMDSLPQDALLVTLGGSKSQGAIFVCFELAKNFPKAP